MGFKFAKRVLLLKKPGNVFFRLAAFRKSLQRPVFPLYCALKAFQTVFEYCPCPPVLSGDLRPFAGLKQGLDNRKKVFLIGGMQPPNIKFQP